MPPTYRGKLDALSMLISGLCMVHCVVLPLLVSTLPVMGIEVMENPWIELTTIVFALWVGGMAVIKGYRKYHRKSFIVWLFVAGMLVMASANAAGEGHEATMKTAGVLLVGIAHLLNYRLAKKCITCKD